MAKAKERPKSVYKFRTPVAAVRGRFGEKRSTGGPHPSEDASVHGAEMLSAHKTPGREGGHDRCRMNARSITWVVTPEVHARLLAFHHK